LVRRQLDAPTIHTVFDRGDIDPAQFVNTVSPLLEKRDARGVISAIRRNWTMSQVVELLDCPHCDAQKVAALALGLLGTDSCLAALARQLRHPDRMVGQMAEHAMWSIWVRMGNEEAKGHFARASIAFSNRDLEGALSKFGKAVQADPNFAEAYNQRAMVHYLKEDFDQSLADCLRATQLMPLHFGAWAGAGHCQACLGKARQAVYCYERAKRINPHLECVDDLIAELREAAGL
jgi:tetratricopeptide (TPR) repeat protein